MKKLPPISLPKTSLNQQRNLVDWRAAWNLDKALQCALRDERGDSSLRRDGKHERLAALVTPFDADPEVAVGQVRLLSPDLCPEDRGPIYVAVLEQLRGGAFLVAPFSRFRDPATPYELRVRSAPAVLSVLSLWNGRPLSLFVLRQSWFIDQMTGQEIEDALMVRQTASRREVLPSHLNERVGAPLIDPRDVRFDYMDEEGEIWRKIMFFPAETETEGVIQLPAFQNDTAKTALQLAADSDEDFAYVSILEVMPQQLLMHVFARPHEKALFLVITDSTGKSSVGLDGTNVSLRDLGLVSQISSGQCLIQADDSADLALSDPTGVSLRLAKVASPSSIMPFAYVRLVEMLGSNPEAATVLTDSELRCLIQNCPRESGLNATVTAEGYFRAWLYAGASREALRAELAGCRDPEIDRLFDGFLPDVRARQVWFRDDIVEVPMHDRSQAIWDRLAARIRSFIQADGIIPVVTGEKAEAVPIAFNLRANESPETAIREITGNPMPLWDDAGEILGDLHGQRIGLQLLCSIRGAGRQFDGESFELPVLLALARKRGDLPDYPSLSIMASGAIHGDTVAAVAGINEKLALAQRMGVRVFVTPGVADGDVVMGVPVGRSVQDIVHKLAVRLEKEGLDRLDTRTAAACLNSLGNEIHMGTVSLADATTRLTRYEKVLERDATSRIATEGLIRAKILKGAIANHSGDPQMGLKATQEASELAARLRMPLLYVNAMANRIVSLTDLGCLAEAESEGRCLLEWVLHDFSGSSAEQMQAEMVACGVLGGQPLLQMALQGAGCGRESLRLLVRAFEIAIELQLSADISRDAVQVALWFALLDSPNTEGEVEKARAILDGHPGMWATGSHAHLQRVRFLGAYRAACYHGTDISGSAEWSLPEGSATSLYWVRATSQKYRGTLLAKQGNFDAAEKDFAAAWTILDRESAPLLRFIGGTVALAAGEALLRENRSVALDYLQKAKAVFALHTDRFEGPIKGDLWLRRTEGLLTNSSSESLPDPQRFFPY